jgi:hypothetical protein
MALLAEAYGEGDADEGEIAFTISRGCNFEGVRWTMGMSQRESKEQVNSKRWKR